MHFWSLWSARACNIMCIRRQIYHTHGYLNTIFFPKLLAMDVMRSKRHLDACHLLLFWSGLLLFWARDVTASGAHIVQGLPSVSSAR